MPTNRAKLLFGTILAVVVVGGLSYTNYQNTKEIAKLESQPVPTQIVKIVTPTLAPTATPAATFKTRISTPAVVTRGVK